MDQELRLVRAAGILEGEGSFFVRSGYSSPTVSCNMTDQDVISELQDLFGGNVCEYTPKRSGAKVCWNWTIHGESAVTVMNKVKPYMFSRRSAKIDEVLLIWNARQTQKTIESESSKYLADAYMAEGLSYRDIGKKYGVSRTAVFNAVKKFYK